MNTVKVIIKEDHWVALDKTLDLLIKNAEKLCEFSSVNIVKEEIFALQNEQERLLKQLFKLDKKCKKSKEKRPKDGVKKKLKMFETLNKTFIDNMNERHGVIKFDAERKDILGEIAKKIK
jgi:hypothetical protein